jgi:hypothetical protein
MRMALVTLVLAVALARAADPKTQPNPQLAPAPGGSPSSLSIEQLGPGKYAGTVVSAGEGNLTLKIEYLKVNQQAMAGANAAVMRQYQQVLRLQQQLAQGGRNQAGTMQQLQRAMAQLQATQARGGVKGTPTSVTVELPLGEDVKVRIKVPPEQFDDKGNIKRYTPAELRELKGKDTSLPGYEASLEALQPDVKVQVTVAALPGHRPGQATRQERDAGTDAPGAAPPARGGKAAPVSQHKVQVKMILILNDAPAKKQPNRPR